MSALAVAIQHADDEARREHFVITGFRGGTPKHVRNREPDLTEGQWRQVRDWLSDIEREQHV